MRAHALFAVASLIFGCASAVVYDKSGNVLEPASSTPYPVKRGAGMELAGTTIRVKKIVFVSVQVYAVGLYVDSKHVGKELAAFAGKPADKVVNDAKLYSTLLTDSSMAKTLRLVMVRTVTGAQMGTAISEAVEARMKDTSKEGREAFATLKGLFSMPELKAGTEITFSWTQGGHMSVKMDEESIGSMTSVSLATALFDVFLGDKAVVERHSLVEHLPSLIAN